MTPANAAWRTRAAPMVVPSVTPGPREAARLRTVYVPRLQLAAPSGIRHLLLTRTAAVPPDDPAGTHAWPRLRTPFELALKRPMRRIECLEARHGPE